MSFLGSITSQISGVITPAMADQLKVMTDGQLQEILGHITETLQSTGGVFDAEHVQSLQNILEQMQPENEHAPDGAPIPHEVDIQSVQAGLIVDAVADNPEATQALMESMSKFLDAAKANIESNHDAMVQSIQNLHSDAGDQSGVQVAVADGHAADGHQVDSPPHAEVADAQEHHVTDDGTASS